MLKIFLINNFPYLGRFKRLAKAWFHNISPVKTSYSQHQEDKYIFEFLQQYDLTGAVYIDVGANHPSDISNTYLLYRNGFQGIIVEPNQELIGLFRRFRKKDIALMIGCSNMNTILPFHISKTPVLSSFSNDRQDLNIFKTHYLPVMQLDAAVLNIPFDFISLLSIDVEGLNYEVLEGSKQCIERSLLICIEYDGEEDKQRYISLLGPGFQLSQEFGCNMLFINTHLQNKLRKK
jgi:FkbM family methyltransferase